MRLGGLFSPHGAHCTEWTDRRVDDLSAKVDRGFERSDRDIRDTRGEATDLRIEVREGFAEIRRGIDGLRSLMLRMNAAIIATVVATALLHGF